MEPHILTFIFIFTLKQAYRSKHFWSWNRSNLINEIKVIRINDQMQSLIFISLDIKLIQNSDNRHQLVFYHDNKLEYCVFPRLIFWSPQCDENKVLHLHQKLFNSGFCSRNLAKIWGSLRGTYTFSFKCWIVLVKPVVVIADDREWCWYSIKTMHGEMFQVQEIIKNFIITFAIITFETDVKQFYSIRIRGLSLMVICSKNFKYYSCSCFKRDIFQLITGVKDIVISKSIFEWNM